jgi:hypothetical protein
MFLSDDRSWRCSSAASGTKTAAERTQKPLGRAAGMGRGGMAVTCTLLGFWRFVIGL